MKKRKSSRITKYILLVLVVFAVLTVALVQPSIAEHKQQSAAVQEEILRLEQENLELESLIAELGTDEAVRKIAAQRLNWVSDNEIVYRDNED